MVDLAAAQERVPILINVGWDLPANVRIVVTSRERGFSAAPYASLNLADHVGDDPVAVARNRDLLARALRDVERWQCLRQVHGARVIKVGAEQQSADPAFQFGCQSEAEIAGDQYNKEVGLGPAVPVRSPNHAPAPLGSAAGTRRSGHVDAVRKRPVGDALITRVPRTALGVLTADCLPIFLIGLDGTGYLAKEIGIAHAGWRGLVAGVVENCLRAFESPPERISAYLGPAIGPCHFEVGRDVFEAFRRMAGRASEGDWQHAFMPSANDGKYWADLPLLARNCLMAEGVRKIFGLSACTYCDPSRYFSYRRDGVCGRMLNAIYLRRP